VRGQVLRPRRRHRAAAPHAHRARELAVSSLLVAAAGERKPPRRACCRRLLRATLSHREVFWPSDQRTGDLRAYEMPPRHPVVQQIQSSSWNGSRRSIRRGRARREPFSTDLTPDQATQPPPPEPGPARHDEEQRGHGAPGLPSLLPAVPFRGSASDSPHLSLLPPRMRFSLNYSWLRSRCSAAPISELILVDFGQSGRRLRGFCLYASEYLFSFYSSSVRCR
jgi:hypothetical protein